MAININHQTNEIGTGAPTDDISISTNSTERLRVDDQGAWFLNNNTGTAGQVLTSNGSSTYPTWQASGGSTPYDIGGSIVSTPAANAIVLNHVAVRTISFADDFAGSFATSQIAATASTVFTVKRNGSSIGTITFGAASTTGTFLTTGGAESFTPSQVLTVHAPASPDATLADISITFFGTV